MRTPLAAAALAAALTLACTKPKREPIREAPEPAVTASAANHAPSPSALPPPPSPSASASAPASPAERLARNVDQARDEIKEWGCSANRPVEIKPHASLLTFRCPERTPNFHFDVAMNEGFLLVGTAPVESATGRGVVAMSFLKTKGGGLMHPMRDGKTSAVVVEYTLQRIYAVPDGWRYGTSDDRTTAFELVDGAWTEAEGPNNPGRGFLVGRDPAPVFPFAPPRLHIWFCPTESGSCNTAPRERRPVVELFEAWDGKEYAADLQELVPAYRARLKEVRPFVEAFAATLPSAPSAGASATANAAVSASATANAAVSASATANAAVSASATATASALPPATASAAAPAAGLPVNPYASLDVPGCPFGILRAAAEMLVSARAAGDGAERAAAVFDKILAAVPEEGCHQRSADLPTWPKLREALAALPDKPLTRSRPKP